MLSPIFCLQTLPLESKSSKEGRLGGIKKVKSDLASRRRVVVFLVLAVEIVRILLLHNLWAQKLFPLVF